MAHRGTHALASSAPSSSLSLCSRRIGIVVCEASKLATYFPTRAEPDFVPREPPFCPDDELLVHALRQRGCVVEPVVWGTAVDTLLSRRYDRIVVRSPWDYMDSIEMRCRFVAWLQALRDAGLPVDNSIELMLWLIDKHYLLDFEACGVPIVPTILVEATPDGVVVPPVPLTLLCDRWHCDALVLKPAISAAGVGLEFLHDRALVQQAEQRLPAIVARAGAQLIQPYLPQIQSAGEFSLVFLGGEFSHALLKHPGPDSILCHAEQGGTLRFLKPDAVPADVLALGSAVMDALPRAVTAAATRRAHAPGGDGIRADAGPPPPPPPPPLYLRIDVLRGDDGRALLSECEGVEPELFFRACAGSADRMTDLIVERIGRPSSG